MVFLSTKITNKITRKQITKHLFFILRALKKINRAFILMNPRGRLARLNVEMSGHRDVGMSA